MNDVNGNVGAAPQPVSNTAGQPAQTQQPAAPSIDPNEFARLQRIEQQYKGVQPFVEKARSYGFTDTKALDEWGGFAKDAGSKGLTPQRLAQVANLMAQSGADEAGSAREAVHLTEQDLERRLTEHETRAVTKMWERQHAEALEAERGELSDDRIKKELDGFPDEFKAIAQDAIMARYMKARQPYGDDSPLKGQFKPAGKDAIGGIFSGFKDSWKALETKFKAGQMVAIGQAANKQSASTVAGSGAGSGKPENTNTSRPGGKPAVADVEAAFEARAARRAAR